MLKHDKDVAAYSGASYNDLEVDGQEVPFLLENDGAPVTPPILTGHGFQAGNEVVLGAATMAQLHKHLGQTSPSLSALPPTHRSTSRRRGFGSSARRRFPLSGSPAPSRTTPPWARACSFRSRRCRSRSSPRSTADPTRPSSVRTWSSSGPERTSRPPPRSRASAHCRGGGPRLCSSTGRIGRQCHRRAGGPAPG